MDLDPRYLEAFVAVARSLNFSRAAAALHKTQPAVSYQIHQLEQQLGTRLFDRTTRRLTLTPHGLRLADVCERFFADFGKLVAELRDPDAVSASPLRIASVSVFGRYILFPILEQLSTLAYTLSFPTADRVFQSLLDGSCDVGFVYLPIVSSRLATMPVFHEELVLVVPASGPIRRLPRDSAAFADLPCITYDESEYVFGKWFETVYGSQPSALRAQCHFEEIEEVIRSVAAGRGWSIVPAHAVIAPRPIILRHGRKRVRNLIYAVTRAGAPARSEIPQLAALIAARARAEASQPARSRRRR